MNVIVEFVTWGISIQYILLNVNAQWVQCQLNMDGADECKCWMRKK